MSLLFALRSSDYSLRRKEYAVITPPPLPRGHIRKFQECNNIRQLMRAWPKQRDSYHKINIIRAIADNNSKANEIIEKDREINVKYPEKINDNYIKSASKSPLEAIQKAFRVLILFSRIHSIAGCFFLVTSVALLPVTSLSELSPAFLVEVLKALVVFFSGQLYGNGLNQIYDVDIDKINKPELPLASGELSMGLAIAIVALSAFTSVFTGLLGSPALVIGSIAYCLLGTIYSVPHPLLRWKRNPFLATTIIVTMRSAVIPYATFTHIQKYVLGRQILPLPRTIICASLLIFVLAVSIANLKDITDIEGDRLHGCMTLSVRLGREKAFWLCTSILTTMYGCAMSVGAFCTAYLPFKLVTVIGHLFLASLLLYRAVSTDLSIEGSDKSYYMFVWKLLFAEGVLIPFIR